MGITKHCDYCDNQVVDFQRGTFCKITNERPNFKNICKDIVLSDKLHSKIIDVNIAYKKILSYKAVAYTYMVTFSIISFLVMLSAYLLGKFVFEKGVLSAAPLIIFGVGLLLLPVAFGPLNNYRRKIDLAKTKKDTIDEVLKLYSTSYTINLKFGKEIHEEQKVEVELTIDRYGKSVKHNSTQIINNVKKKYI